MRAADELDTVGLLRLGSDDACSDAMPMLDAEASMPRVVAPNLARLCWGQRQCQVGRMEAHFTK